MSEPARDMERSEKCYLAIDLKSFYASAECVERGLNPLDTYLVVADESRTDKTICLAVTPPLKSYGIPGRPRLFEVRRRVAEVNAERRYRAGRLSGASSSHAVLQGNPSTALEFLIAPPRMALYIDFSTRIYHIYTRYVSSEHIIVYSIDEVFIDVTPYLSVHRCSGYELAGRIIRAVAEETGITATAGVGTNLYLAKVAMDIVAKHIPPNREGVRIASLDEMSYRRFLWGHRPLTDFWRVGKGTVRRLAKHGLYTMGDIARRSVQNDESLYRLFGKNAELLIDHAWGWEPCTVEAVHACRPASRSLSSGQVLPDPYEPEKAKLVLREMADQLSLDLVAKNLMTDQVSVTIGFDVENLKDPRRRALCRGELVVDSYGRAVPKHAHATYRFGHYTSSSKLLVSAVAALAERLLSEDLLVRRLNVAAAHVLPPEEVLAQQETPFIPDLFRDTDLPTEQGPRRELLGPEHRMQQAVLGIRSRFGKNAILKGMNLVEGATAKKRNTQIGGHQA